MESLNGKLKYCFMSFVFVLGCFGSQGNAQGCSVPVQPIKKGMEATCDGYLFSPDAESSAYKATRISELQKEENEILQKRLDLYIKQSDVLAKELAKRDNTEDLYRIAYFVGGILITGYLATNLK